MKNITHTRDSEIILPLPVPAGTLSGAVVALGTAGLFGICETDRFVAASYTGFTAAPQGLKDGQASVRLIGAGTTAILSVDAAGAQFAPVYVKTADNTVTLTATGAVKCGYLLAAVGAAGPVEVVLTR